MRGASFLCICSPAVEGPPQAARTQDSHELKPRSCSTPDPSRRPSPQRPPGAAVGCAGHPGPEWEESPARPRPATPRLWAPGRRRRSRHCSGRCLLNSSQRASSKNNFPVGAAKVPGPWKVLGRPRSPRTPAPTPPSYPFWLFASSPRLPFCAARGSFLRTRRPHLPPWELFLRRQQERPARVLFSPETPEEASDEKTEAQKGKVLAQENKALEL
ncbi:uncharacterized protein LOC144581655 [Callithrix jacchus]